MIWLLFFRSVFEDESDLQLDAVFPDLSFISQHNLLALDPGRL